MITKSQIAFLKELRQKSARSERSLFIAEGPKAINEFLSADNVLLHSLYATEITGLDLPPDTPDNNLYPISANDLKRISALTTPNQCVAVFHNPHFAQPVIENRLTLLLDNISDPGNLGTIIRCADWFGISNIICSVGSVDCFNPKVVQSTMGSLARVQVGYTDLESIIRRHNHIPVYAATLDGTPLGSVGKVREGFLLVGSESHGISPALLPLAKHKITIPRVGQAESLNAGVATGILLSHLKA